MSTPRVASPGRRRLLAGTSIGLAALAGVAALTGASLATGGTTPREAAPPPRFVDVTASAGIAHRNGGEPPFEVGAGVAILDCSDDGFPDLFLAGGSEPAALYRNATAAVGAPIRFEAVDEPAATVRGVMGAYPIDFDGDGLTDLAVLRAGESLLLRGLGDCRFERANERWEADLGSNALTTAFSATWEDESSLPTIAVGRYLALDERGKPTFDCDANLLLRPDAMGRRYGPPLALAPGYCTLGFLFSDWDRSGRRDLRMTNDRHYYLGGTDQLWRVAPGEDPRPYTADEGWVSMQIWGMGIASRDLTGDGYPEVYLTSQGDNKLQTLSVGAQRPRYRDIALKRGVTAAQPIAGGDTRPSTAWHPEFADVNADGFVDLFVTKGNVLKQPTHADRETNELFLGRPDGTFENVTEAAGLVAWTKGRGAALVDLDLDGLIDLVEQPYDGRAVVRRNVGSGTLDAPAALGNSVALRLRQPGANRDAIGAWLEVRVGERHWEQELVVGGGHAGGQLGWVHVGIGPSDRAAVRVRWPDGSLGGWETIERGRFVIVDRAAGVRPWSPGEPLN